jgi:hypothetical protein
MPLQSGKPMAKRVFEIREDVEAVELHERRQ